MSTDPNKDYTDEERDELASEPDIVINTTSPKAKGFNFKIIGAIAMGIVLTVFLVLQFNVMGKKEKSVEEIEKEKNAETVIATPQAMQGIESVNKLPGSYQNANTQPLNDLQQNPTGAVNNQELMANQQKAAQNPNGQYNGQQPYNQNYQGAPPQLPAPTQEQQEVFDEKKRLKQLNETRIQQREAFEQERIKQIAQEHKTAFTSSIKFNSTAKSTTGGNNTNQPNGMKAPNMPTMPDFKMPDMGMGGGDQNKQKDKQAFLDAERKKPNYLNAAMNYPASPYQIMAGAIIPSSFITGLNSDLPGQIIGQVRENVYDTVRGRYLLIPQSTRIIGEYSSGVTFGQDRILIVWTRLVFPDGTSINLEGMPGVDLSGYAGSRDKVNHHYMKIASAAVLSSLMSAGVKVAAGNQEAGSANFQQLAASGAAQTMGSAGDKMLSKIIEQQSTIEIRPGTKFNVFVNKDIILKPYKR